MKKLTLYKLSILLSAEGWRKTITELEAHETDINIIYRTYTGHRKYLRKDQPLECEFPIYPSHKRIGIRIFCRAEQKIEAARIINAEMTKTINQIREEYTAMMDQVPYQPNEWISFDEFPTMPISGELKLS